MARRLPPVWWIIKHGRSWPGIVTSDVPQGPIVYPPPPPGPPPPEYVTFDGVMVSLDGVPVTFQPEEE